MEPTVMEESAQFDTTNETPTPAPAPSPAFSYDDVFPALPESNSVAAPTNNTLGQWGNKMRIGTSNVNQVFHVPFEERRDASHKFGEGESNHNCLHIMKETSTVIEISVNKDQSLTFLVQGKQPNVHEARRRILQQFQTQAQQKIHIPQDHHRLILGKAGARLKELEKATATKITIPRQNEDSDLITITGPKEGIDKAVHEINIISDEHSRQANERVEIPKIYHPFITGANNEKVNALMEETGVKVHIPPPSVMKDEISIAGEKQGVQTAKERILQIFEEMKKRCTTVSIEVPKAQHKYIIGHKGSAINEILSLTGVSVEMPHNESTATSITLRGPHDKIGAALTMVYEKANSVGTEVLDAPAWLHKYIIGRKGSKIKELTQDMPKVHVEFADKDKIKIEGPPEEVAKVAEILRPLVSDLVRNMVSNEINVDIKYHKHIIGKAGANINKIKEDTGVTINISENSNSIRIEGLKKGVDQAKQEILDMVTKLENEKDKDVIIDHRYFKSLIGTKGEKIKELRDKFSQVQIVFPTLGENRDVVKVRGPKKDVDECCKCLTKMVKDLKESSFVLEVPIYKQFHKFIVGKAGANIRKIRDETQTKIDLPVENDTSDVIVITGKKENVELAQEQIQKIQNELANIVTDELSIPPKFYKSLIGAGGKLISSIMEDCGGVNIKFPASDSKSDKVVIRGPKDDVEKAKQQLLELSNERQLASVSAEVRAKPQHHKFLIGKNGANIKRIRDSTGARIIFPTDKDEDKEVITIIGKKESVEAAKTDLENVIKEIANTTESTMTVEPKHHRHFVTRRGEVLHRISDECGGVLISFPRANDPSDQVALKGAKECIEAAKARILEIISDLEAQVSIECVISQQHHRTVLGTRGSRVHNVQAEHNVQIKFPDRDNTAEYIPTDQQNGTDGMEEGVRVCDVIRITGKLENCQAASQALKDLVPIVEEVPVPHEYHRAIIGQKGKDVRELMNKYDVRISVAPPEQQLDVISVIGVPANVAAAKEGIKERIKELEAHKADMALRSFEAKVEIDAVLIPKIIGRKGAGITKIRTDHNVQISVPQKGDENESTVTITGYEKDVYAAQETIMKIVNEMNDLAREPVEVDARLHSRLIGARGRNLRKMIDQFKVDFEFPRGSDPDPNIVTLVGPAENIDECKEYLLNLVEEYTQDMLDEEYRNSFLKSTKEAKTPKEPKGPSDPGFVVQGAPWEQKAPNMESKEEFPSFGGAGAVGAPAAPSVGGWGPKKWGGDTLYPVNNYQ